MTLREVLAFFQEAEAEEEGEAQRIAEWDQGLANEAYKAEIERAQAEQQRLDEEAAAWVIILPKAGS